MKRTHESRNFTLPSLKGLFSDWDWDDFAQTVFTIVVGSIVIVAIVLCVGALIWALWTSGLGGIIIAFISVVIIAVIIAAIIQIMNRF